MRLYESWARVSQPPESVTPRRLTRCGHGPSPPRGSHGKVAYTGRRENAPTLRAFGVRISDGFLISELSCPIGTGRGPGNRGRWSKWVCRTNARVTDRDRAAIPCLLNCEVFVFSAVRDEMNDFGAPERHPPHCQGKAPKLSPRVSAQLGPA